MNFIDTAENYDSEEIIGEAIKSFDRKDVIVGTKFVPENSSYQKVIKAAENSLKRLQTDYIDVYQTHWPNHSVPIEETLDAMLLLKEQDKVRQIGVGNLRRQEFKEVLDICRICSFQTEYNLFERVQKEILDLAKCSDIKIIAYSPIDKGRIVDEPKIESLIDKLSKEFNKTKAQIALRWLIQKGAMPIPKASSAKHLQDNIDVMSFELSENDISDIDELEQTSMWLCPHRITVTDEGEQYRKTYKTVEDAKANALGFAPSPCELADNLIKDNDIKPIRLIEERGQYRLVEGRIRYWAWVIAFGAYQPLPCKIRSKL
tara:strand:+ start:4552 stop:5502 length:951 start_codon:yes stop_codon:yes gene_type:complete